MYKAHLKNNWTRLAGCMLAGAVCMLAFTLPQEGYVGISDAPPSIGSAMWLVGALYIAAVLWLGTGKRAARPTLGMAAFGFLFGVVNYFATTLFAYDSWRFLNSVQAWGIALVCVLVQGAVMTLGIAAVCGWLENAGPNRRTLQPGDADAPPKQALAAGASGAKAGTQGKLPLADRLAARFPKAAAWFDAHPILSAMAFLLVCWSPYLLVFYPGTVIWDMGEMIGQFYGLRELTTWHPVFTTWVFGACVWLGRLVGSDNLGAFLFTLLQTVALAYALAEALRFLRRLALPRSWQLWVLLFCGLTPIYGSFAQAIGKDTLYTAALLLFAVYTAQVLRFGRLTRKEILMYAAAALLSCLVRSNGLYVVLGTAVLMCVFGIRGKVRWQVSGALLAALVLALGFSNGLLPALQVKDETASGLYSAAFQQTARVLRDYPQEVTPQEFAEIEVALDAQNLPTLYEPVISDPVKYTFKQYGQGKAAEVEALTRYRKTWLAMLAKHPITYLEAFVAGNTGYYAFTPKIDAARTYNYQGGIRFVFETYELGEHPLYLHTQQINAFSKARELLAAFARGWRRVPLLELTMFCGAYTWLLVAAGLSLARRKRFAELLAFVPALLSLGVCMLSPVNDYFRYFLPIVAMTPPLLGLVKAERVG